MNRRLGTLLCVLTGPGLLYASAAKPPVYFTADAALTECRVFGVRNSPQISSNRLQFGLNNPGIDFRGARPAVPCTMEQTESILGVFTGHDSAQWRSGLPLARRIRFHSIYPGIDLVYYGAGSGLEYDFELQPNASYSRIEFGFDRNARVALSPAGDLIVSANGVTIFQRRPRVRQDGRDVEARYLISGDGVRARMVLGSYDHTRPLTIDPVLSWQTTTNGNGGYAQAVASDASGDMWMLTHIPGENAPFTNTFGPGGVTNQIMLLKVDPTGSQLLYAVRIGGSGGDVGAAIAIGSDGSAYVTGYTGSSDFPVTAGAFQASLTTPNSAFVVKISPAGDSLVYSTYLSGEAYATGGVVIAVDQDGDAFVGGQTYPGFPLTQGSWQDQFGAVFSPQFQKFNTGSGYLSKLNSSGSQLIYSTLVDGVPASIALGPTGAVYLLSSLSAQSSAAASYTLAVGSSGADGSMITRLTPDGTTADLTVFLGCLSPGRSIALDSADDIIVAGSTTCATFPATANAFQSQHSALVQVTNSLLTSDPNVNNDGLIVKIAPDASSVLSATFLGGGDDDEIAALSIASDDSIVVAGGTNTGNFPTTAGTINKCSDGPTASGWTNSGFFTQISANLSQLLYSTCLAGGGDQILSMALDVANNAYLGGASFSGGIGQPTLSRGFSFDGAGIFWALKLAQSATPAPAITSTSPAPLTAGSAALSIQISGTNFAQNARVLVDGGSVATTFVSSSQLTAVLNIGMLQSPGTLHVLVLNPGSAASLPYDLAVVAPVGTNPYPRISALMPDSLPAGSPAQTIRVNGYGFVASSVITVNGTPHATAINADGTLAVALTTSDLASVGALIMVAVNSSPGGGASSPATFVVSAAILRAPAALASMSPSTAVAGSAATVITINASGLSPSDVVRWNGTDHPISAIQAIQAGYAGMMTATFTATPADLASVGTAEVTIHDYLTGFDSNPLPFWTSLKVNTLDMASSQGTGQLFLVDGSSLAILNTLAGAVEATVPLVADTIRVSSDGSYLYAANLNAFSGITRYELLQQAPWLGTSVALPHSSGDSIQDFAPMPGSPGTIAVAVGIGSSTVTIYDGAIPRPNTTSIPWLGATSGPGGAEAGALQFSADGGTLYFVWATTTPILSTMPVTAKGVGKAITTGGTTYLGGQAAVLYEGRIYTAIGSVFDATTLSHVGTLPASSFTPLAANGAIIIFSGAVQGLCSLQAFDPVTLLPLWEEEAGAYCYGKAMVDAGSFVALSATTFNSVSPPVNLVNLVGKPSLTSQHSVQPLNQTLTGTFQQTAPLPAYFVPVTGDHSFSTLPFAVFVSPDQPGSVSLSYIPTSPQLTGSGSTPGYFAVNAFSPGLYTGTVSVLLSNTTNPPATERYQLALPAGSPVISNVQDAESARVAIVPGEWAAIYGSRLALTTRTWNASDFVNGNALPTILDEVTVTFGGIPAAVYYVSPTQLDVQVPTGISGTVPVVVSVAGTTSSTFNATVVAQSPSLFVYSASGALYAAATHLNGTLIGDPAAEQGATKAAPGETIVLYVNGLTSSPSGAIISTPVLYGGNVTVTVGAETAIPSFAGLVSAGEFQLNVQLPSDLAAGNYLINVTAAAVVSPGGVVLSVQ